MKPIAFITLGLSASLAASLSATAAPGAPHSPSADKTYPDQSTMAAKTTFSTAAATAAKGALDAKNLAGAEKMIGKPGTFQGTVSTVYSPKNHAVVILDFDREYDQALTAIARPSSYAKLPDLATLKGRHVLISGQFKSYKGKPEIEIDAPSQIKLLP